MKENSVLNIIMYLFKYHMHDDCEFDLDQDRLVLHLEDIGFPRNNIIRAFSWLANLAQQETDSPITIRENTIRVFSDYEYNALGYSHCRLIMSLEQQGILNPTTRELVINQLLELEYEGIDESLVKWVTLIVLFNQREPESLSSMEFLVLDETVGGLQ